MMYGLYVRQSVEKESSISIETQLSFCYYECRGELAREYIDAGFSGKNINRPGLRHLLEDVKAGEIKAVIVYRLDRISRSLLDFVEMMELFEKYGVTFISSTERFDTSTPMGRAMINMAVVFAQLERETIQERVSDAYEARCKTGKNTGGRTAFGYSKNEHGYTVREKEAEQIRKMFELYQHRQHTLSEVAEELERLGFRNRDGRKWIEPRISDILKNPIYVKADKRIFHYYRNQGVVTEFAEADFTEDKGIRLFHMKKSGTRIMIPVRGAGIVTSRMFLSCQKNTLWGSIEYGQG